MLWSEFDHRGQIRFGQNYWESEELLLDSTGEIISYLLAVPRHYNFSIQISTNYIRSKWYNIYCIFRGDHDLINLLCLIVCRYKSFFFFSLVVEMQFDIKKHAFEAKPLNEADIVVLETGTLFPFSRCLASFLFCVAQDGMICFGCSTNIVCWV